MVIHTTNDNEKKVNSTIPLKKNKIQSILNIKTIQAFLLYKIVYEKDAEKTAGTQMRILNTDTI